MIDFLLANWIWIAFIVVMVAMHRHGGHGGHGHHDHGTQNRRTGDHPASHGTHSRSTS